MGDRIHPVVERLARRQLAVHQQVGHLQVAGVLAELHDPNWNYITSLDELSNQLKEEISHFFAVYKQPEGKHVEVDGWYPLESALEVLELSRERFTNGDATPA